MHRISDGKRVAQFPVYSEVNSLCASGDLVSLAMKDRRILSYLIVDSSIEKHSERISKLESRDVKALKSNSKKILKLLDTLNDMLDNNSSDEEYDADEIFEDKEEQNKIEENAIAKEKESKPVEVVQNVKQIENDEFDTDDDNEKEQKKFIKKIKKGILI
jgi:hypothetical protein